MGYLILVLHKAMDRHQLIAAALTGLVLGMMALFFSWPMIDQKIVRSDVALPPSVILNEAVAKLKDLLPTQTVSTGPLIPVSSTVTSDDIVRAAWDARESWSIKSGARVLLVPHHLVASRDIASLISAFPKKPSKIFFIAPDHFSQGRTALTVTDRGFASSFGTVQGDPASAKNLLQRVLSLQNNPAPFEKEHGVTGLIPFIGHAWPDISFIPIIVRLDAKPEDQAALSEALIDELKNDTQAILISSIDFSHNLPAEVADLHDIFAQDVIKSLADREADRVELDSPGALAITLKVARKLGLGDVTIHSHTNSLRILQTEIAQDSTSHILASFAPGSIRAQQATTMLFVGDMMFDRNVATRSGKNIAYPFSLIRGVEDRFFKGHDFVVGNFECPATSQRLPPIKSIDFACPPEVLKTMKELGFDAVSQANNHALDQGRAGAADSKKNIQAAGIAVFGDQVNDDAVSASVFLDSRGKKIAMLGFNTTDNPLDETQAMAAIKEANIKADHVIVYMHWGAEYKSKPAQPEIDLAHRFIDAGVDAVIGAHPHWMESVEVYKGKPIAYSLGNFIFDQDWSEETQFGLVAGLVLKESGSELHLYPIRIDKSRPRLLTGEDRRKRLQALSAASDGSLSPQIEKGVILISK